MQDTNKTKERKPAIDLEHLGTEISFQRKDNVVDHKRGYTEHGDGIPEVKES